MSSFDAFVVGAFNGFLVPIRSAWGRFLANYSKTYPELFDANFTVPTTDSVAQKYSGPIVAVSMFAVCDREVPPQAAAAIKSWAAKNRTNIRYLYGRKHVNVLGECSTDDNTGSAVCLSAADEQPKGMRQPIDMHRCSGKRFVRKGNDIQQEL